MSDYAIVDTLPQPLAGAPIHIHVPHARETGDGRWEARAIVTWPDGSRDEGAIGLLDSTKRGAETMAEKEAVKRIRDIENGFVAKTHPTPMPSE